MPLKVYYLDDERELLEIFSEFFSTDEVVITTFHDPTEAEAFIAKNPPDLLFLDYRLPSTTGDEIALRLDKSIPKVLLTGEMSLQCKAEFIAHFEKPFKSAPIRELIANFVKRAA